MDLFEAIKHMMGGDGENRPVVRTIPMRPEWTELRQRSDELEHDIRLQVRKLQALREEFWVKVKKDSETYEDLRLNREKNVIEVLEGI